ncbi:MAG: hypothetical protein ACFFAJ_16180 [Candidatus Hodarchaeota archaeon]
MGTRCITKILILLVAITVFFSIKTPLSPTESYTNACQYQAITFLSLGYETSTFRHNESVILEINCTGSAMNYYIAKIHLHGSGSRIVVRYIVNKNGELQDVGFFNDWGNFTVGYWIFMEGSNQLKFDIVAINADPDGFITIFSDSYIEIFTENDIMYYSNITTGSPPEISTDPGGSTSSAILGFVSSFISTYPNAVFGGALLVGIATFMIIRRIRFKRSLNSDQNL